MQRISNWPRRLSQLIASSQATTFEWGHYDCAMFVCAAVREITGVDVGAAFRGTYHDESAAEAIFLGGGFADLGGFAASIAAVNSMPEVQPTFARRGDVVWIDNDTPYGALGIVALDPRLAACMSDAGIVLIHMDRWKRAWQVG
jgi:uncharacterized protein DUF6950